MTLRLFGFDIPPTKKPTGPTPVPLAIDEPSVGLAGGFSGIYDDNKDPSKQEFELIKQYRQMAQSPEVDSAINEIINEFVIYNTNEVPVEINLEKLSLSDKLKEKITKEFKYILKLLDFENKADEIIRKWYIDGKIFYHNVVDPESLKLGVVELRPINALHIRKRKIIVGNRDFPTEGVMINPNKVGSNNWKMFYEYNRNGFLNDIHYNNSGVRFQVIPMTIDSIASSVSGLFDMNTKANLSYLNKARKPLNQLRHLEDATVIYRLSRAPERRAFFIDVGGLSRSQAEQEFRQVIAAVRQQISYNQDTGEVIDDKKHMSILEDFILPRRDGKTGTEITTLPGGQNLGELKDVEYFRKKIYNSLNLPPSRLTDENKGFNLGKSNEILRDELKFTKFIAKLRKSFSRLFVNILKVHLILKNIVTIDEWDEIKNCIQFDWLHDNHFNELKEIELMSLKMNVIAQADPYIGRYISIRNLRKKVMHQ